MESTSNFFNTTKPYEITKAMTNGHHLSADLVSHVYMIMIQRDDIENELSFFTTCAYRQWSLPQSEFNRLYRPVFTSEFNESTYDNDEEVIHNDKYREFLNEYLKKQPTTIEKWYIREIAEMWMSGETYRNIAKKTKINPRYISEAIKQFKYDILTNYNRSINKLDSDEF